METMIALILPFLLGLLGLSIVLQLLWTWSLSAIAAKTEQSELMQVLAWIPILQIAPMIVAGGGSVGHFLLSALGLVLGVGTLAAVSAALGSALGMLLGGLSIGAAALLCIAYFGRLAWNTALNRDLPGWVGLLVVVPFLNLIAYPYLAFHDGWIAPHKVGLVIGLVVTIGSAAPSYQTIRLLQEAGGLSSQLAMRTSSELDFQGLEASLEQQLASELVRQLGGIESRSDGSVQREMAARGTLTGSTGPAAIPAYSANSLPPTRPIPIQPAAECPIGTELWSEQGDRGDEEWCQQLADLGGLRHGWYARYAANGRPESLGEYDNGLRVGVWTRFHPSGGVRAQAEFAKGLQHGWLLTFDESGERTKAIRFEEGVPAR